MGSVTEEMVVRILGKRTSAGRGCRQDPTEEGGEEEGHLQVGAGRIGNHRYTLLASPPPRRHPAQEEVVT